MKDIYREGHQDIYSEGAFKGFSTSGQAVFGRVEWKREIRTVDAAYAAPPSMKSKSDLPKTTAEHLLQFGAFACGALVASVFWIGITGPATARLPFWMWAPVAALGFWFHHEYAKRRDRQYGEYYHNVVQPELNKYCKTWMCTLCRQAWIVK